MDAYQASFIPDNSYWLSNTESFTPRVVEASTNLESAGGFADSVYYSTMAIDDTGMAHEPGIYMGYANDVWGAPTVPIEPTDIMWVPNATPEPYYPQDASMLCNPSLPIVFNPPSPVSEQSFTSSPTLSFASGMDLPFDMQSLDGYPFDFTCPSSPMGSSGFSMYPSPVSSFLGEPLFDFDKGYGQPLSQQTVTAANPDAGNLSQAFGGMEGNAGPSPFPSMTLEPSPRPQQDAPSTSPNAQVDVLKRARGSENTKKKPASPPKRRKPQDTTPKHKCRHCEEMFARTNNLKKHVDTVHLKLRPFKCADCGDAFSRKHDLTRHVHSKHKKLGSPRRKGASSKDE